MIGNGKTITLQQFKSGKFSTPYKKLKINLIGAPFDIAKVIIDENEYDFNKIKLGKEMAIEVSKEFSFIQFVAKAKTRKKA